MKVEQRSWHRGAWNENPDPGLRDADWVVFFGGQGVLDSGERHAELRRFYPNAHIMGCSTGGEILNEDVLDHSVVAAAVKFDATKLKVSSAVVDTAASSRDIGRTIALELNASDLTNIFILSDGTNINGTDLLKGLYGVIDGKVIVTGGLAGDGADFKTTLVGLNDTLATKRVIAVGFYGDALEIGYGSVGGWDPFGPERKVTKSRGNILYELDGKPALDLYKEYLGEDAAKLPGSALLFPLLLHPQNEPDDNFVRTIVGVDEESKSMIFAGDIPEGYTAQLMNGNFTNLIEGAARAAELALSAGTQGAESLAILVSCIGRKLLLGQRISDEAEAVWQAFEGKIPCVGFYSYGEICHQEFTGRCSLHNQTMTVSVFSESRKR